MKSAAVKSGNSAVRISSGANYGSVRIVRQYATGLVEVVSESVNTKGERWFVKPTELFTFN